MTHAECWCYSGYGISSSEVVVTHAECWCYSGYGTLA